MKIGLVGFSSSGKSTAFKWLTGVAPDPSKTQQGQMGVTKVPDVRLDAISAHFKPKKTTFGEINFLDTPGLLVDERKDNPRRLGILRESAGLVIVLDGFGRSDLVAQLRKFREEILFADLEIIMNRIDKLRQQMKKPKPQKERDAEEAENTLLARIVAGLEAGAGAAAQGLTEDEEKAVRSFQLLTLKPEQVLVSRGDAEAVQAKLPEELLALSKSAIQAAPQLELELEELPEEDRAAFMADMGFKGSDRHDVIRKIFYGTGRIVFFTVGEDECRSWPLMRGATAVEGAGEIHTDLAKRFVRAEVVSHDDFKACGYLMKEAKAKGVHRLEGKTYIVQDGDIMHIL